ncbi:MAG: activase [Candidatus Delongbacteria bacterium]|nr:activase [Candidatus Delongbacteria bacterium]MBN2836061.1 activase [Candidatus Delongbacteria bacterium]
MRKLFVSFDIGSTTIKCLVTDDFKKLLFKEYRRHYSAQKVELQNLFMELKEEFPDSVFALSFTGSGGKNIADKLNSLFIQEVICSDKAVKSICEKPGTVIEIGGQDAKLIGYVYNEGKLVRNYMRMNNSCAGGTGAFIDEIATLLNVNTEDFDNLASKGNTIHDISGRCGVFAKTDIQPLLNNGICREDIALSTCHAIVRQIITGLGRGNSIASPLILCGGPIAFTKTLVNSFKTYLNFTDKDLITPEEPEYLVSYGALLHLNSSEQVYHDPEYFISLLAEQDKKELKLNRGFFNSEKDKTDFYIRHDSVEKIHNPSNGNAHIGIDAGSTTVKLVLLDESEKVVYSFYKNSKGKPLDCLLEGIIKAHKYFESLGFKLDILSSGATGYGENLVKKAFNCDYSNVETICHYTSAKKLFDDVSFILDIGGQDMKAIFIDDGTITDIVLNEACSAGCGSFLENYSISLGIDTKDYSRYAFSSNNPADLGSRCTVFMNSSIITEQRDGKSKEDILAGLSFSIVKNLFSRILRGVPSDKLKGKIVVQGGTFKNDAVLRAFEIYSESVVHRAPYPGLMGAVGVALLAKQNCTEKSNFLSLEQLKNFSYTVANDTNCSLCLNNCTLHTVNFSNGKWHTVGNRCEKGEHGAVLSITKNLFNGYNYKQKLLNGYFSKNKTGVKIGIPLVFDFWNSLPFFVTLFNELGFNPIVSSNISREQVKSDSTIPSDTVCYPAKITHGHIRELVMKGCNKIFFPMIHKTEPLIEKTKAHYICSVVQGYPLVIKHNMDEVLDEIEFLTPQFHFFSYKARHKQTLRFLEDSFGIKGRKALNAVKKAMSELKSFKKHLFEDMEKVINSDNTILLAGRPYHNDRMINQDIPGMITSLGYNVLSIDNIEELKEISLTSVRAETDIAYQDHIYRAAIYCAGKPNLNMIQIVSFGCGHDAIITDEVSRILKRSGKQLLVLKVDETVSRNAILIRLRSFIETITKTDKALYCHHDPFEVKYDKADKKLRTILIPNISESFAILSSGVMKKSGYLAKALPFPDERSFETGKMFTNNDVCFPVQLIIGDAINYIRDNNLNGNEFAFSVPKIKGDCRLAQYSMISRKAFDDAGYSDIAIITTGEDNKGMHPGFISDTGFQVRMLYAVVIHDIIEMLYRKSRSYEAVKGSSKTLFKSYLSKFQNSFEKGLKHALRTLEEYVEDFNNLKILNDDKDKIFVTGEVMLKHHHIGNRNLERFLENHGYEVIVSSMLPVLNKDYIEHGRMKRLFHKPAGLLENIVNSVSIKIIDKAVAQADRIFQKSKFYSKFPDYREYSSKINSFFDSSYAAGEGCLIPSEIVFNARAGIKKFIIVQPFGCMPNHITGRGMEKVLLNMFPDIKILSLDYDPDISMANIENRLLMFLNSL